MSRKVDIVLVNYRNMADTNECVLSLKKTSFPIGKIFVIDNTEKADLPLPASFAAENGVVYRHLDDNPGFAGGNNRGIEIALQGDAEYILLLNNDTVVKEDFLERLVAGAEKLDAGVATGKILYYSRPQTIWGAGGWMNWQRGMGQFYGNDAVDVGQCDESRCVEFVSGCMMLIRRDVFKAVGLLDETYFMYCEDVDYCLRAARAGYKLAYVADSVIWHKVGAKKVGMSPFYLYYFIRNSIKIVADYGTRAQQLTYCLYSIPYFTAKILLSTRKRELLSVALKAWRDARSGRWGKAEGI